MYGFVCSMAVTLGHTIGHLIHCYTHIVMRMYVCMLTHHSGHGLNTKCFTQLPRLICQQWVCQSLSLPADGLMQMASCSLRTARLQDRIDA